MHISAEFHSLILNLVPNYFLGIEIFQTVQDANYLICIFMKIHENIIYQRKIAEKVRGYTYKILYISAAN